MTEPETGYTDEEDLELLQIERLLNVFEALTSYDARERAIKACERMRDE